MIPLPPAGFVKNEVVREMIAQSKALILPTQVYESFPITILEAMSVGTPIIGSDLGNTGCLIENGKSGWKFAPKDSASLADAVRKMMTSPVVLGDDITGKYSAEKNYEQLRNIYETCCNHH